MRRSRRLPVLPAALAALATLVALAASSGSATAAATALATTAAPPPAASAPCRTGQIAVRFTAVPGSAGAGSIVYALRVTNSSNNVCSVTGLPRLQLLDAKGKALPTHQVAAHPGMGTAVLLRLGRGEVAWAAVRFSPDVPGVGEQTTGQCQRTAARIRATVGAASAVTVGPIVPATAVCSNGRLSVDPLSRLRPQA